MWRGGQARLVSAGGALSISHDASLFGGDSVATAPPVSVDSNLSRWLRDQGTTVSFSGTLASPDGGGSLFFESPGGSYRVTVRPETGLAVRSWLADE